MIRWERKQFARQTAARARGRIQFAKLHQFAIESRSARVLERRRRRPIEVELRAPPILDVGDETEALNWTELDRTGLD